MKSITLTFIAILLTIGASTPGGAYCVYNVNSASTIHVNVSGSGNLKADIPVGGHACCPGGQAGCEGDKATITLPATDARCEIRVSTYGWILATLTEDDVFCESLSPNSALFEDLLRESNAAETFGEGAGSEPPVVNPAQLVATSGDLALCVNAQGSSDYDPVTLARCSIPASPSQTVRFEQIPDTTWWHAVFQSTNSCLEVSGENAGAVAILAECEGDSFGWTLNPIGNSRNVQLFHNKSGFCLDQGNREAGTQLRLADCNVDGANQTFLTSHPAQ